MQAVLCWHRVNSARFTFFKIEEQHLIGASSFIRFANKLVWVVRLGPVPSIFFVSVLEISLNDPILSKLVFLSKSSFFFCYC